MPRLRVVRRLVFWRWSVQAMFRHLLGRWHYWRDVPDWVVSEWAAMCDELEDEDEVKAMARLAVTEMRLRIRQLQTDIERACRP